jgi:hypothetical protein
MWELPTDEDNGKNYSRFLHCGGKMRRLRSKTTILMVLESFSERLAGFVGDRYFAAASRMAAERLRASAKGASWDWARGASAASMPSLTPGITTAA